VVLVKASRAARLERVAEALLASGVAESGTR
jgi:UDP-N-acetylmuramyl pentapeptide synthase